MQRLEVSGAVRPIYGSLGVKRLRVDTTYRSICSYLTENSKVAVMRKASWRRQCWYMAVAYIANCTQSTGNPVRMSVLVEI